MRHAAAAFALANTAPPAPMPTDLAVDPLPPLTKPWPRLRAEADADHDEPVAVRRSRTPTSSSAAAR
jgi:hypothetical protein